MFERDVLCRWRMNRARWPLSAPPLGTGCRAFMWRAAVKQSWIILIGGFLFSKQVPHRAQRSTTPECHRAAVSSATCRLFLLWSDQKPSSAASSTRDVHRFWRQLRACCCTTRAKGFRQSTAFLVAAVTRFVPRHCEAICLPQIANALTRAVSWHGQFCRALHVKCGSGAMRGGDDSLRNASSIYGRAGPRSPVLSFSKGFRDCAPTNSLHGSKEKQNEKRSILQRNWVFWSGFCESLALSTRNATVELNSAVNRSQAGKFRRLLSTSNHRSIRVFAERVRFHVL